ncbi:MAG TPA: hypothetical protein VMU59_12810 [Caulobacteraceae bacterium]|nr:hypothetical protein [Caulobacteraceae bacterium]
MNGRKSALAALAAALTLAAAGASQAQPLYRTTFVSLAQGQAGLVYTPLTPGAKARIGVFAMHDNGDYFSASPGNPCVQLAQRGYTVLCSNATSSKSGFFSDDDLDKLLLNVKAGVAWLRKDTAVDKVVIFGHSGGGEMMAAYQNIAENGVKACQGPEKLIKCSDALADMPAADGVMLIDSVMGGPVSTLISLDPAVTDEDSGAAIDPSLDMYNPANGFKPSGSTYSAAFETRFFAAEGARMNRLIDKAEARLKLIEAGKGRFADDEPFLIPGSNGAQNRLNAQDLGLMAHTKAAWPLLHADGTVTNEVIYSVRVPRSKESPTPSLAHGAIQTTVKEFLRTWAIRSDGWRYDATAFHGLDYASSYGDEIDSIQGITKPLLQMGMTGSYEYFAAEQVREHARSQDKTLAYVEGALHTFEPCKPCAVAKGLPADHYGDTVKTLFDYVDGWLSKPGRFIP